jgi:peptide/nickel transport system permease protein
VVDGLTTASPSARGAIPAVGVMVAQRLALGLLTLVLVSMLIFGAMALMPGDFATAILGQAATPDAVAAFRRQLGLDTPAVWRYGIWIGHALHGDFGQSYASAGGEPRMVTDIIAPRLNNTLFLAGVTACLAVPLAIALGLLAALYRGSWLDRGLNIVTLAAISSPEFFMAYILMLYLAVRIPIFPSLAGFSSSAGLGDRLYHIALPVLTLTLVITAHMMRMTRTAVLSLLAQAYVEMARYKGLRPARILLRHALPNAWAPIAYVVALNLAYLIVGVVVVETVFVYPGIGQTMVDAVRARDVPVVQACALIFATTYILLNLVADVVAIATNPRLLYPR